ncbi:hypothetical protein ACFSJW_13350 [Flavobacterium artemisiae]|uniref:Uncharacterized protein n=1 Tax=Flavobacterium artemisiae TaxID=2126556 RepID=A0ABW4HG66_9FLAO
MADNELFNEIIKTNDIFFRGIKIGDTINDVRQKEGTPTEENLYNNPFLSYFYEVGEMEEITVYYNFIESTSKVTQISLYFISYPDFYWKKEGSENYQEFSDMLVNNKIQKYSKVFLHTLDKIVAHFTALFNEAPSLEKNSDPFNQPYQNYKSYSWTYKNEYRLSVISYIDDSIDMNVKNTLIIYLKTL